MDRQRTPRQAERHFIAGQLAERRREAEAIKEQRATLRQLPLLQRLSLGNLGRRLSLWVDAGCQEDLIAELQRQQR